jgi:3',5'-cyclic AMP phosphodiesterase CpdA
MLCSTLQQKGIDRMPGPAAPPFAIIADAHFHDLAGDYGGDTTLEPRLRPLTETIKSTRIFNESGQALRHALDDIAGRGIRHVVVLGDYSDDGQIANLIGLRRLLDGYRQRFGMRFIATPGNHDLFGANGRHRTKRFLATGGGCEVISSDPAEPTATLVSPAMRGVGYRQSLEMLPDIGFFHTADDLHWETPFGSGDDLSQRFYTAISPDGRTRRDIIDASYLVEPIDGTWLLMIDANVFVPLDGGGDGEQEFADSSNAGWNAMLVHKPIVLDWIADVARRAERLGKTLLAFSHYPALDPLDATAAWERDLLGETSLLRRIPEADVGAALIKAGIKLHFSGHLHVNDTARMQTPDGFLINVSVPSLVAFPAAYKILTIDTGRVAIETVGIGEMRLDPAIMERYATEVASSGIISGGLLVAPHYEAFLSAHLERLVGRRHLKRDWPVALAEAAHRLTLAALAGDTEQSSALEDIPAMALVVDWYRARMASDPAIAAIAPARLAAYRLFVDLDLAGDVPVRFQRLAFMIDRFLSGLPSNEFAIDLVRGEITAAEQQLS